MTSSEKLCLKWCEFQQNISSEFGSLRDTSEFADVTLASEDGDQIEAHKVILSASSSFFKKLLTKNPHAHPLIYMKGVRYKDLVGVVDFLYYGEVNIYQDNLAAFLAIADELKLMGITENGQKTGTEEAAAHEQILKLNFQKTEIISCQAKPRQLIDQPREIYETKPIGLINTIPMPVVSSRSNEFIKTEEEITTESEEKPPKEPFSGDIQELDVKTKSMMSKGKSVLSDGRKAYACHICGMKGRGFNIKKHIKSKHIEGLSIPCKFCDKSFRSSRKLKYHTKKHQKE